MSAGADSVIPARAGIQILFTTKATKAHEDFAPIIDADRPPPRLPMYVGSAGAPDFILQGLASAPPRERVIRTPSPLHGNE